MAGVIRLAIALLLWWIGTHALSAMYQDYPITALFISAVWGSFLGLFVADIE